LSKSLPLSKQNLSAQIIEPRFFEKRLSPFNKKSLLKKELFKTISNFFRNSLYFFFKGFNLS